MNRFKFNALRKEFPFIDETVMTRRDGDTRNLKDCDYIRIARATREMLHSTPNEYSWDGSLVGINEWDRVDFVLYDGTIMRNAVQTSGTSGSNYAHSGTHEWEGETVLEAILRHGIAKTLKYVVWTKGGYNIVEHYSERNFNATVYKPSREFTWQQVIEEAEQQADKEVKAEANF